jgi:AraC-like DNA-binding protein
VLSARTVFNTDGVEVADVSCRHPAGPGREPEYAGAHAIILVRRGCFVRSADGVETLLDPTSAYCLTPGQEARYDHPLDHGDDCTAVFLDPDLAASLWGGDCELPSGALHVAPEVDLEHRLLLAAGRRGDDSGDPGDPDDPDELAERAIAIVARTLEQADRARVTAGRPATRRARHRIADEVREALVEDRDRSLRELSRVTSVSPHHLSRLFRAVTGHTISQHRMRLRARDALERLGGGEQDLARVAADAGFVDQSHLCRILRQETGRTPSELRAALAAS